MMQQQGIDLSGLKDVHLPPMPPAWPPSANVWYAFGVLIVLITLVRFMIKRSRRLTAKKYAMREVGALIERYAGDNYKLASEISLLLRRIALLKFPREDVASLTGKKWREFLERTSKKADFKAEAGDVLENIMYIPPEKFTNRDVGPLIEAAKLWIAEQT